MRPRGMKVIRMARVDKETSAPIRKSTLRYLSPSFRPLLNFLPDKTNNSPIVEEIDHHLVSSRLQKKKEKRPKKEKTKKERKNNVQIVPRDSSK